MGDSFNFGDVYDETNEFSMSYDKSGQNNVGRSNQSTQKSGYRGFNISSVFKKRDPENTNTSNSDKTKSQNNTSQSLYGSNPTIYQNNRESNQRNNNDDQPNNAVRQRLVKSNTYTFGTDARNMHSSSSAPRINSIRNSEIFSSPPPPQMMRISAESDSPDTVVSALSDTNANTSGVIQNQDTFDMRDVYNENGTDDKSFESSWESIRKRNAKSLPTELEGRSSSPASCDSVRSVARTQKLAFKGMNMPRRRPTNITNNNVSPLSVETSSTYSRQAAHPVVLNETAAPITVVDANKVFVPIRPDPTPTAAMTHIVATAIGTGYPCTTPVTDVARDARPVSTYTAFATANVYDMGSNGMSDRIPVAPSQGFLVHVRTPLLDTPPDTPPSQLQSEPFSESLAVAVAVAGSPHSADALAVSSSRPPVVLDDTLPVDEDFNVAPAANLDSFTMNDVYDESINRDRTFNMTFDSVASSSLQGHSLGMTMTSQQSNTTSESVRSVSRTQRLAFKGMNMPKKRGPGSQSLGAETGTGVGIGPEEQTGEGYKTPENTPPRRTIQNRTKVVAHPISRSSESPSRTADPAFTSPSKCMLNADDGSTSLIVSQSKSEAVVAGDSLSSHFVAADKSQGVVSPRPFAPIGSLSLSSSSHGSDARIENVAGFVLDNRSQSSAINASTTMNGSITSPPANGPVDTQKPHRQNGETRGPIRAAQLPDEYFQREVGYRDASPREPGSGVPLHVATSSQAAPPLSSPLVASSPAADDATRLRAASRTSKADTVTSSKSRASGIRTPSSHLLDVVENTPPAKVQSPLLDEIESIMQGREFTAPLLSQPSLLTEGKPSGQGHGQPSTKFVSKYSVMATATASGGNGTASNTEGTWDVDNPSAMSRSSKSISSTSRYHSMGMAGSPTSDKAEYDAHAVESKSYGADRDFDDDVRGGDGSVGGSKRGRKASGRRMQTSNSTGRGRPASGPFAGRAAPSWPARLSISRMFSKSDATSGRGHTDAEPVDHDGDDIFQYSSMSGARPASSSSSSGVLRLWRFLSCGPT